MIITIEQRLICHEFTVGRSKAFVNQLHHLTFFSKQINDVLAKLHHVAASINICFGNGSENFLIFGVIGSHQERILHLMRIKQHDFDHIDILVADGHCEWCRRKLVVWHRTKLSHFVCSPSSYRIHQVTLNKKRIDVTVFNCFVLGVWQQ